QTTQRPASSAGRIVRSRWSDRAAYISRVSVRADQRSASPETAILRISSAPGEPPGSRVWTTSSPAARSRSTNRRACVVLPAPSPPSNVMNLPRCTRAQWRPARRTQDPSAAYQQGVAETAGNHGLTRALRGRRIGPGSDDDAKQGPAVSIEVLDGGSVAEAARDLIRAAPIRIGPGLHPIGGGRSSVRRNRLRRRRLCG